MTKKKYVEVSKFMVYEAEEGKIQFKKPKILLK